MADFTFLFNRKGALYPLDLTGSSTTAANQNVNIDTNINANKQHLKSINEWPYNSLLDSTLVHLCAKVIVNMPAKQIDKITDQIPAELFIPLFKASLYPVKDQAIDVLQTFYFKYFKIFKISSYSRVLINKWPFKSLIVSKFLSNMFSSILILYSDAEMAQRTRLG